MKVYSQKTYLDLRLFGLQLWARREFARWLSEPSYVYEFGARNKRGSTRVMIYPPTLHVSKLRRGFDFSDKEAIELAKEAYGDLR